MEVTVNGEQRLFVIPEARGWSCLGFDVVYKHLRALGEKLARFGIDIAQVREEEIGSLAQYEQYREAIALIGDKDLGTWFDPDTPKPVRAILERYRKTREHLRVFYGEPRTGRDWLEESDVVGRVGRSTGMLKIPLLIAAGESGGPGMLDGCIVRLMDVRARRELYRHATYHQGEIDIRQASVGKPYTHGVWVGGEHHANFRSYAKAAQWVAFMAGECMQGPR